MNYLSTHKLSALDNFPITSILYQFTWICLRLWHAESECCFIIIIWQIVHCCTRFALARRKQIFLVDVFIKSVLVSHISLPVLLFFGWKLAFPPWTWDKSKVILVQGYINLNSNIEFLSEPVVLGEIRFYDTHYLFSSFMF